MGFSIEKNLQKNKDVWRKVTWSDVATYIGPNAEYYQPCFEKLHQSMVENGRPKGFAVGWHWAAFIPILGIPWAAARKQWLVVGLMIGVVIMASIIVAYSKNASFGFMMFFMPMMATNLYVQMAVGNIVKIKATVAEGPARDAAIRDAGGLNMTYGYIAGGICGLLLVVDLCLIFFGSGVR